MDPWAEFASEASIRKIETEYHVLREYLDDTLEAAKRLRNEPAAYEEALRFSKIIREVPMPEIRKTPFPVTEDDFLNRFIPVLILLPNVPEGANEYLRRGFTEAETQSMMPAFYSSMKTVHRRTGKPGLNRLYFGWLCHYMKADIFHQGAGFQFEIHTMIARVHFFQNPATGDYLAMMSEGLRFHRTGHRLGNPGYEDERGSFTTVFNETETTYEGHLATKTGEIIAKSPAILQKSDWKEVLKPGDTVLNLHIGKGANLAPDYILPLLEQAMQTAKTHYPECDFKCVYCLSWLLDPTIVELIGDDSNIVRFGNLFSRFPARGNGEDVFNFVFPLSYRETPPAEWETHNRLEEALKERYLHGGAVITTPGAMFLNPEGTVK